jgi:twitching motility protein PilT
MDIEKIVEQVIKEGGNEVQFKIGAKPLMRRNRVLKKLDLPAIIKEDLDSLIKEFLSPDEIKKIEQKQFLEINVFGKLAANIRLSFFWAQESPIIIVKILNETIPSLTELSFPAALMPILEAKTGLFILTGPARSGISTTLAAIVEHLNQNFNRHIATFEDPIEFNFVSKNSKITQRQIGKDILDLNQALNFSKKMDVDTYVISDIKQNIPFKTILDMVSSGNFVIMAMSSLGFASALEKIALDFPEEQRDYVWQILADNLKAVCSQALILSGNGTLVSAYETLIMNNIAAGIVQKGKTAQLEGNIMNFEMGSALFNEYVNHLVLKNAIDKPAADNFIEQLKSTKV